MHLLRTYVLQQKGNIRAIVKNLKAEKLSNEDLGDVSGKKAFPE